MITFRSVCLCVSVCVCVHTLSVVPESRGEIGELTFIHILTGWIPEVSTIK